MHINPTFVKHFWEYVTPTENPNSCWLWAGYRNRSGYGQVSAHCKHMLAHRVSWEIHHGPVPDGLFVLHHCDVPSCVNPDHLWLGTHTDNMRDMSKKQRHGSTTHPECRLRGSDHPVSKLTNKDVRQIRALASTPITISELSRRYGVTRAVIRGIIRREGWKHVT